MGVQLDGHCVLNRNVVEVGRYRRTLSRGLSATDSLVRMTKHFRSERCLVSQQTTQGMSIDIFHDI